MNNGKGVPCKKWAEGCGKRRCKGTAFRIHNAHGGQCLWQELAELEYCWWHVPEGLIPLAEQITGLKRCRDYTSVKPPDVAPGHAGERCGNLAYPGTDVCVHHGAITRKNGDARREAFEKILDGKALPIIAMTIGETKNVGNMYPSLPPPPGTPPGYGAPPPPEPPAPIENPFQELLILAAEMKVYKDRLAEYVAHLDVKEFRYEHDRAGEQLDANVQLYAQAMERLSVCLTRIAKLNIEERMIRITERQQKIIENAIGRTISDLGLPPELQQKARVSVVRRLRAA